jgi:hypothetical protein
MERKGKKKKKKKKKRPQVSYDPHPISFLPSS